MTDRHQDPWILNSVPRPQARMRLFCLPHAGGGAALYRQWPAGLPESIEVLRVQLPGREGRLREPGFTDLPALIAALWPAVQRHLDRPFALFGHSMGALIAFELARECRRESGRVPLKLFAAGYRAPHLSLGPPIHQEPTDTFLEKLRERYDGVPEALLRVPELLDLLLPVVRADLALCETYVHTEQAPLDCDLLCYGGERDPWVTREHLLAWERHTGKSYRLRMLPGDHFFIDSNRAALIDSVTSELGSLSESVS